MTSRPPAIILFGAAMWPGGVPSPTLKRRVEAARRFGATLERPLFVPTGGVGRYGPAEACAMADLLRAGGVPDDCILVEDTALDTTDSVFACRRLLAGRAAPVYAATSGYHLPRCLILLRLAGVPARPCPPLPELEPWWMQLYRIVRECAALAYDCCIVLRDRLH